MVYCVLGVVGCLMPVWWFGLRFGVFMFGYIVVEWNGMVCGWLGR